MNNNIVFKFSANTIYISEMKREVDYKSLNNTNIIDVKDLKFSINYIKENFELVTSFLSVVIIKRGITTAVINNLDIALISIDLINTWDHITNLVFKPDKIINYDIFLKLLDCHYLKEIEVFDMSTYLIERLDTNRGLKVKTRNKVKSESKFTRLNMINSYSDIYYKKVLVISSELSNNELEELKSFINISNRLKIVKIINYSNEILTTVINELELVKKKNILIEIYEKENDLNTIFNTVNYLKKKNKNYFEKNNIKFKINYSDSYKEKNFFKAINLKLLFYLIFMVTILSLVIVGINLYQLALDEKTHDNTMNELNDILIQNIPTTSTTTVIESQPLETTTTEKPLDPIYLTDFEAVFDTLLKMNKDTVGWISVNNTKINYPVLQSTRNSYYLWRDFNKKQNNFGWIFMDYRNNHETLDQNTIIYGHNVKSGVMFGTIRTMMNPSWYKNESNRVITFNTLNKNMKWLMFSTYRIPATEDYLQTSFDSEEEFMDFINTIKSRSIHDFNVDIKPTDKILTMQTCSSNNTRNVVHAVLIEEINTN